MRDKSKVLCGASLAAMAITGFSTKALAAATIDGTLTSGEGYTLVSTQTNVTTGYNGGNDSGNPTPGGGFANEEYGGSTGGNYTNISNAYAYVDPTVGTAGALNLFIGGSIESFNGNDSKYDIALQLGTNGVSNLNNQTINGAANTNNTGGIDAIEFNGIKPTALFTVFAGDNYGTGTQVLSGTGSPGSVTPSAAQQTGAGGASTGVEFTDLTGNNDASPLVAAVLNNALVSIPVGSGVSATAGTPADPGFAGASTGLELSIDLDGLGYTPGTPIEAFVFPSVGQDGRTDNQILAPFTYGTDSNGYDYVYDGNSSSASPTGRQFSNAVYPGAGFFTIAGASVPEPASLSLLALGAVSLLGRRHARKV